MIRAVVIDDEYLARQRILKLLEPYEQIKVIGEAKSGSMAVEVIDLYEPELIFLDVQMPDFDGFEVVKRIRSKSSYIVFTTAYDSYAIQAFDVHALDYLLKPIDEDRFVESMEKVITQFEARKTSAFSDKLVRMIKAFEEPTQPYASIINIQERGMEHQNDRDEVLYREAKGNYIGVVTKTKAHLYRSTMNARAVQLNPDDYIRIHRSSIVNKRFIKSCSYQNNNEYLFKMKDGKSMLSGRSYKQAIMEYLSQS